MKLLNLFRKPTFIVELYYNKHTEIIPNIKRVNECECGLLLLRDREPALVRDVPDRIVIVEQGTKNGV